MGRDQRLRGESLPKERLDLSRLCRLLEKGVRVVQLFNGSNPAGGNVTPLSIKESLADSLHASTYCELQKIRHPRVSGDGVWIQLQAKSWLCRNV